MLKYEEFIKKITVIVDKQEKKNMWITNYFRQFNVNYVYEHLQSGDYTFILDSNDFSENVIVERKNSLTELSQNFTPQNKRKRFYNEFFKLDNDCKKYIIIENDNIDNMISGVYGSDFNPNSFIANLLLLQLRLGVYIYFVNRYNMGLWILKIFYYSYYYDNKVE